MCCRAARSLCTMANHSVSASGSPHAFIRVRLPIRALLGAFHRPLGVLAIEEQHLLAHAVSLAGTDLRAVLLPSFEGKWYVLIVTLFLATFVHEFIAIGIAAYSVADHRLSL